jgi:hypothetical protein
MKSGELRLKTPGNGTGAARLVAGKSLENCAIVRRVAGRAAPA